MYTQVNLHLDNKKSKLSIIFGPRPFSKGRWGELIALRERERYTAISQRERERGAITYICRRERERERERNAITYICRRERERCHYIHLCQQKVSVHQKHVVMSKHGTELTRKLLVMKRH